MNRFATISKSIKWSIALLFGALAAGCGGDRDPILGIGVVATQAPTVTASAPAPGATGVATSILIVTANFSEPMNPITGPATFTVTCALPCTSPTGTVALDGTNSIATFTLGAALAPTTTYTGTITGATSIATGVSLAAPYVWTFTTGAVMNVSVFSSTPAAGATLVCPAATIDATFTVPSGLQMDPLTVTSTTFTVVGPGPAFTPVVATSIALDITGTIATFTPSTPLVNGDLYTVTIVSGASGVKDLAIPANQMLADMTWTFTAGPATGVCAGPSSINMGTAASFAIAATAGVTNTPTAPLTHINGDVVLDPNFTCNAVSVDNAGGFGLCGGAAPTINGQVITNTFPNTTDSATIKADLNSAFLSITPPAGPPAVGSLAGGVPIAAPTTMGDIAGNPMVLGDNYFTPGVWISGTSILISNDITLDALGDANAEFFFQSASTLTTADGAVGPGVHTRILLVNGAKASNVWWQVASSATLGNFTEFNGNVLAAIDITMKTGTTSCGRLMAGAWVGVPGGMGQFVFDSNVVSVPGNGCPP